MQGVPVVVHAQGNQLDYVIVVGQKIPLERCGSENRNDCRQFMAASGNLLRAIRERHHEDLSPVVLTIDRIHFGGRLPVVALGLPESREKSGLSGWHGRVHTPQQ